jgi:hypothetical protein
MRSLSPSAPPRAHEFLSDLDEAEWTLASIDKTATQSFPSLRTLCVSL